MQGITPQAQLDAQLTLLTAVGGTLNGAKVVLFTGPALITPDIVVGDLVLATFNGYATSSAVVWGTVYQDANGRARAVGASKQFTSTNGAIVETIIGFALVNGTEDTLLYAQLFDAPVIVDRADAAVIVVPEYTFDQHPVEGVVIT